MIVLLGFKRRKRKLLRQRVAQVNDYSAFGVLRENLVSFRAHGYAADSLVEGTRLEERQEFWREAVNVVQTNLPKREEQASVVSSSQIGVIAQFLRSGGRICVIGQFLRNDIGAKGFAIFVQIVGGNLFF